MKINESTYLCTTCGQEHTDLPALAFSSPANYAMLSESEQDDIAKISSDFCEIHYEDQIDRFIRVTLTQKINDNCVNLDYGLWVSLSEESYTDYWQHFDSDNHEAQYFGWLCSIIPEYESTMSIPCTVQTKPNGERPEIFPHQDFEHPFVADYYNGISQAEAQRRVDNMHRAIANKKIQNRNYETPFGHITKYPRPPHRQSSQ